MMKLANLIFLSLTLTATNSFAEARNWFVGYYAGTLNILDVKTQKIYKEDVVMYHLTSTKYAMVTQMACVSDDGGPSYLAATYMRVYNDGSLRISDQPVFPSDSNLSGRATTEGKTWFWSKFNMKMKYVYDMQKPDKYKTMLADVEMQKNAMKVRKKVWDTKGTLRQKWSGSLSKISREKFLEIASDMNCPEIP